jgi:hypothetical protein
MEVLNVLFHFSLEAAISCYESHVRSLWASDLTWRFCDAVSLLFQSTCLHCKRSALKLLTEVPCRGKRFMSISCYRLLSFYPHSPEAHSSPSAYSFACFDILHRQDNKYQLVMFKISKQSMSPERQDGILRALNTKWYARILIHKHLNVFCEKRNVIITLPGKGRILMQFSNKNFEPEIK